MNTPRHKPQPMPKPEELFVSYKPERATSEGSEQIRHTRLIRQILWQRTSIIITACALFFAIGLLLGACMAFIILP